VSELKSSAATSRHDPPASLRPSRGSHPSRGRRPGRESRRAAREGEGQPGPDKTSPGEAERCPARGTRTEKLGRCRAGDVSHRGGAMPGARRRRRDWLLGLRWVWEGWGRAEEVHATRSQKKTRLQNLFEELPAVRSPGSGPAALAGAAPGSLRGRRGQAPVHPLREVPQLRQEVAQVDLVFVAQGAVLGKEDGEHVGAGSRTEPGHPPKQTARSQRPCLPYKSFSAEP